MRKYVISIFLIVYVLLVVESVLLARQSKPLEGTQEEAKAVITYPQGEIELVEVADSPMEQARGLSNRAESQPMLFLFPEYAQQTFWMNRMLFALDFVWLRDDVIVGTFENALPEEPAKTFYSAPMPVNAVLELPAGSVRARNLKAGDVLDIEWHFK